MQNAPASLGRKFDQDKPRWDLVPMAELDEIVRVLTHGSKKYAPDNWRIVPHGRLRYFSALMRHLVAWWLGEKNDPETGYSHLSHAGCNVLFLMGIENAPAVGTNHPKSDTNKNEEVASGKV